VQIRAKSAVIGDFRRRKSMKKFESI
jgi:hypothetical protein